jgi:hypothetical protein
VPLVSLSSSLFSLLPYLFSVPFSVFFLPSSLFFQFPCLGRSCLFFILNHVFSLLLFCISYKSTSYTF